MSQTTAIASTEAVAAKPSRLILVAAVLAVALLLAALVVIGYPLAIVLGLVGTGAFLTSLVALTAADAIGGKGA
ncbi:MAG: hypothetical protein U1E30_01035 [Rhodoblastus sp.]|mgnify:CR=1|jgi:hypothetical protein